MGGRRFRDGEKNVGGRDAGGGRAGGARGALGEKNAGGARAGGTRDAAASPASVTPARGVWTLLAVRSLRANRVRTTVTLVGIMLAAGLLMAVLSSLTSLRAAILDSVRSAFGVWQVSFDDADAQTIDDLRSAAGDHLDRLSLQRDLGAVALDDRAAAEAGICLAVLSLPEEQAGYPRAAGDNAYEVLPGPSVETGRLPERPGEIALPTYLRGRELSGEGATAYGVEPGASSEGRLDVGDEVTLAAGRRVVEGDPTLAIRSSSGHGGDFRYDLSEDGTMTLTVENLGESMVDVGEPRTYVVVGFVADGSAYVCTDEPAATASGADVTTTAYFSTTGYRSDADLADLMDRAVGEAGGAGEAGGTGGAGYATNDQLLMYQGMSSAQIFDSLAMFGAVLAAVIVVAAVSLVSNAFTISISERTRQFGLLSSLGASRRQLRRTVFAEAAVLGAVGVPAGIALGLAATAAVFALTAGGWEFMVGSDVAVRLVVAPADVAVAAGLSAVTLLASALLPAVRASRVSAVDAIRQVRDVRPSRRLARVFRHRRDAMDDLSADRRRPRGLAARVGGMPAFLARRQLRVSGGKSRTAAAALAVSVALLVSAGLVGDYLTGSLDYVDDSAGDVEAYVASDAAERGADDPAVAHAGSIAADIAGVDGVAAAWPVIGCQGYAHLSPEDVDWGAVEEYDELAGSMWQTFQLDREGYGVANVWLLDDATWRGLAGSLGLSEDQADPANLSCVAVNAAYVATSSSYASVAPLTGAGDEIALLVTDGLGDDQYLAMVDGSLQLGTLDDETGEPASHSPAGDLGLEEVRVPVAATADALGDGFPMSLRSLSRWPGPTYLMPLTAALDDGVAARALSSFSVSYRATFADGAKEDATIDGIEEALASRDDVWLTGVYNIAEEARRARSMSFTVDVFLYSFTAITMAIAVANVFNTIASSLMLRTREFAALQSAGMGHRAFRRMIALECADFALKGLVGGILLAVLVDVGFYLALSSSISTLSVAMPWGHVALACAVVVGVLAVAAAYALRRTHAMNLVEALRADAL